MSDNDVVERLGYDPEHYAQRYGVELSHGEWTFILGALVTAAEADPDVFDSVQRYEIVSSIGAIMAEVAGQQVREGQDRV